MIEVLCLIIQYYPDQCCFLDCKSHTDPVCDTSVFLFEFKSEVAAA